MEKRSKRPMPVLDTGLDDTLQEIAREEEAVRQILEENKVRYDKLTLVGIDQFSGKGIPGHKNKVKISGFSNKPMWITDELLNVSMWKKYATLGSVSSYVDYFNAKNNAAITEDDVVGKLLMARLTFDPAFAFWVCDKIQDKLSGRNIPFRLNYAQIILVSKLEEMRISGTPIRIILLKARQWGGSTLVQLYMAWIQLFHMEGWNSVIIAQTKDTAKRIKAMYARVLKHFPASIVYGIDGIQFSPKEKSTADYTITDQSGNVVRDNVITVASYENFESTRGANFAMMHGSEVAYWNETQGKTAEDLITNISSGILFAPMTLEVLESTANGMSGYFYDEYQLAKQHKSNREAVFIPFFYILNDTMPFKNEEERKAFATSLWEHRNDTVNDSTSESGEYLYSLWEKGATLEGINWYIQKRKSFHDHASMASEAPSDDIECFKHSGQTIFNQYLVDKYRKDFAREPIYIGEVITKDGKFPQLAKPTPDGELFVWARPDHTPMNDRYIVVVDVGGRSTKADFSVITVVDRLPLIFGAKMEVVARWRGHIRYDFLAAKAVLIARLYNNAKLVFESNTFDKKKAESTEYTYEGDHTRGILSKIEDEYENLYLRASTSPEDLRQGKFKKVGFQTNVKTKQDMVDKFIVSFEDNADFLDPDERVYAEMAIYERRPDGSLGNIPGKDNHDDILMTDMIANFVSDEMPLPTVQQVINENDWNFGTRNESLI